MNEKWAVIKNARVDVHIKIPLPDERLMTLSLPSYCPESASIADRIVKCVTDHDELTALVKELHWIVHAHLVSEEGDELLRRIDALIPGLESPFTEEIS